MKQFLTIIIPLLAGLVLVLAQANSRPAVAANKCALWQNGVQLRGANIHQRRSYLDADGDTIANTYPVIPPYSQADFDKLAAMGANYVNISHPGLYTETAPYQVDATIEANLDNLLQMIANANLHAVIAFRTGPGRNEFIFLDEEDSNWLGYSKDINFIWPDPDNPGAQDELDAQAAQDAWVDMWAYTANRYKNNPTVAGYDLMVEPNANVLLDIWDPAAFYPAYANTLYDWNQLYPDIAAAARQVDANTPILIGGMSYSSIYWLNALQPTGDPCTVYTVHFYEPFNYTHQDPPVLALSYPGVFDGNDDGNDDAVNQSWLNNLLAAIDTFKAAHNVPVAVNEYGLKRWQPGADDYMADVMALLEQRHTNHALWLWAGSHPDFVEYTHPFDPLLGPDPDNRAEVQTSDLLQVIQQNWALNSSSPGDVKVFLPLILKE